MDPATAVVFPAARSRSAATIAAAATVREWRRGLGSAAREVVAAPAAPGETGRYGFLVKL